MGPVIGKNKKPFPELNPYGDCLDGYINDHLYDPISKKDKIAKLLLYPQYFITLNFQKTKPLAPSNLT